MKTKSPGLFGTLTLMALLGSTITAQAESRVRVVRAPDSYNQYAPAPAFRGEECAPAPRYRRDHGRHRGWFHRQPVVYVPVVQHPVVYRQAYYEPRHSEASSFFLHVSDSGTQFGIALGR